MSKKDSSYFDNFIDCIRISKKAATELREMLGNYGEKTDTKQMVDDMHKNEHMGDWKRHELVREIVKAFITPIDRDDIMRISQSIDSVTDSVEEIVLHLYTWNVKKLRPDALEFSDLLISCCESAEQMLLELPNYKKSEKLMDAIVEVNRLEEVGDKLYINALRKLSLECSDPLTVMAWREIYQAFENVCDCCEAVATLVEAVTIANT